MQKAQWHFGPGPRWSLGKGRSIGRFRRYIAKREAHTEIYVYGIRETKRRYQPEPSDDIFSKIVFSRQVATYVTLKSLEKPTVSEYTRHRSHNSRDIAASGRPTGIEKRRLSAKLCWSNVATYIDPFAVGALDPWHRGESTSVIARYPKPNAGHFSSVSERISSQYSPLIHPVFYPLVSFQGYIQLSQHLSRRQTTFGPHHHFAAPRRNNHTDLPIPRIYPWRLRNCWWLKWTISLRRSRSWYHIQEYHWQLYFYHVFQKGRPFAGILGVNGIRCQ